MSLLKYYLLQPPLIPTHCGHWDETQCLITMAAVAGPSELRGRNWQWTVRLRGWMEDVAETRISRSQDESKPAATGPVGFWTSRETREWGAGNPESLPPLQAPLGPPFCVPGHRFRTGGREREKLSERQFFFFFLIQEKFGTNGMIQIARSV